MAAYQSDDHADGEVVDASHGTPTVPWMWRTREVERGIIGVDLASDLREKSPSLWFVNVDEANAAPPATNLVAFATEHFPRGTVVSRYAFATLGIDNQRQAGALRWYRNGIVHQIFVAQEWRRKLVASTLLYTASAFHQANGWPGYLRSDGRRTDLGNRFAAGARFPQRVAPLDLIMPAMDPENSQDSADV